MPERRSFRKELSEEEISQVDFSVLEEESKKESRETERRAEEERIRESEQIITDWADSYASIHQRVFTSGPQRGLEFDQAVVEPGLLHFRKLVESRDLVALRFIQETQTLFASSGYTLQEKYPLTKIYQRFGRYWAPSGKRQRFLGFTSCLAALLKESLAQDVGGDAESIDEEIIDDIVRGTSEFFRSDEDGYQEIDLAEAHKAKLPEEFFDNPTQFIEALSAVEHRRPADSMRYVRQGIGWQIFNPYDAERVHCFEDMAFKRVDLSLVGRASQEVDRAEEARTALEVSGIGVKVPAYYGMVYDRGNIYTVQERIPHSLNLLERAGYDEVLARLAGADLPHVPSNVLVQYKSAEMRAGEEVDFWLVDFEESELSEQEEARYNEDIVRAHAPRIERSVNESSVKERDRWYEQQGLSVEFSRDLPGIVEDWYEGLDKGTYDSRSLSGFEHLRAFYLSSSDAIELLR